MIKHAPEINETIKYNLKETSDQYYTIRKIFNY